MAPGPARSRCTKDAAIRREMAEWKPSELREGGSPGKPNSETVEEGAHGGWVRTGRGRPRDGVRDVEASSDGKVLRYARCSGDEACQVRVEHVTVLWVPAPGSRQDGSTVRQKGLYPRMQVSPWPGDGVEGRRLCLPGFKKAGAED